MTSANRIRLALWSSFLLALIVLPAPLHAQSGPGTPFPTPQPLVVPEPCRPLMTRNVTDRYDTNTPWIRILAPGEGPLFSNVLTVTVEAGNFDLTAPGHHWHLWLNGTLAGMVYEPTAMIGITPGTYTVCAILGDGEHFDLGIPAAVTVTVYAPGPGTLEATLPPLPALNITPLASTSTPILLTPTATVAPAFVTPPPDRTGGILLILAIGLLALGASGWLGRRFARATRK